MDNERKRYQVFVSSTYDDLIPERQAVIQALLRLDCIPVTMELFPAASEDQWSLIEELIRECDYYVVIVGGRYGSVDASGMSYTEREYRLALQTPKLPVLGFLHAKPETLPLAKSEHTPERLEMLEQFRKLVKQKPCNFWTTPDELSRNVILSMVAEKSRNPRPGWTRNVVDQQEVLRQLIAKEAAIAELKDEAKQLKAKVRKREATEKQYKAIIRSNIESIGNLVKGTKSALYEHMFEAIDLTVQSADESLGSIMDEAIRSILDSLLTLLENQIRTIGSPDSISVSVKAFVNEQNATKILDGASPLYRLFQREPEREMIVTLARDTATLEQRPDREVRQVAYRLEQNSDFSRIVGGERHFLSNDLYKESTANTYDNENPNWKKTYNATAVVPISFRRKESDKRQVVGFLTVDSLNSKGGKFFTPKDTIPILEFGAELLMIVFLNLGLFDNQRRS